MSERAPIRIRPRSAITDAAVARLAVVDLPGSAPRRRPHTPRAIVEAIAAFRRPIEPERFAPFAELHRRAAVQAGHDPATLPLSINSHGYIAEGSRQAADELWPSYAEMMNQIGRERGWSPISRAAYDAMLRLRGALFVGSPTEIIHKILFQHEIFGHQRFLMQIAGSLLPHRSVLRSIELLGTEVAPVVRDELARRASGGTTPDTTPSPAGA